MILTLAPLGNLKAFPDEETDNREVELAKSSQIVRAKARAEGPVLDSKSSPYSDNKSRSPTELHNVLSLRSSKG